MIYCEKNVMNVAHLKKRAIQKKKKKKKKKNHTIFHKLS